MSHRLDRVYTTFVVFFWETLLLSISQTVNYIDFIVDIHTFNTTVVFQIIFKNSLFIPTVSIVVMGKFGDLHKLQLELHIVGYSCMQA